MTQEMPSNSNFVGVFLSHASKDKPFVKRLAIDLINRGIPIWFDRWELDTGDSLLRSIAKGIDDSTRLILVLSQSSIGSPWVQKEIDLSLAKEMQTGQIHLLPIRIDSSSIPPLLADKIHTDFAKQSDYYSSLEQLVHALQRIGAADLVPHPSNELIAAEIKDGIFLLKAGLMNRLNRLFQRIPKDFSISQEQIVFGDDVQYDNLRSYYQQLLVEESTGRDGKYNAQRHNSLEELNQLFHIYDRILHEGTLEILNGLRRSHHDNGYSMSEACFWFIKQVRSKILLRILSAHGELQLPLTPEYVWAIEIGPTHPYDSTSVKKFYEIEEETYCDVWIPNDGRVFKVSLDSSTPDARDIAKFSPMVAGTLRLTQEVFPNALLKHVVPKMVYDHLLGKYFSSHPVREFDWDLSKYHIGLA